jgi:hypothetical protein
VRPDYFSIGNCFHKVLELTFHNPNRFGEIDFRSLVESYDLNFHDDGARIAAMLRKYWALHLTLGLTVLACEIKFSGTYTNGIIDAIMVDDFGEWWIVDLKTSGKKDNGLPARISKDMQLNLYAAFRSEVAAQLKLDPELFAGIRYREALKPLQVRKSGELFDAFTVRCEEGAECREIVVPACELDSQEMYGEFSKVIERAHALQREFLTKESVVGRCNFKACLNYNSPCEWFSLCYGKTYSQKLGETKVFQTKTEKSGKIAIWDSAARDTSGLVSIAKGEKLPEAGEEALLDEFGAAPAADDSALLDAFGNGDEDILSEFANPEDEFC